eukprot:254598-Prymnesium_polylepis.2
MDPARVCACVNGLRGGRIFNGSARLEHVEFDSHGALTTLASGGPHLRHLSVKHSGRLSNAKVSAVTRNCPHLEHLKIPGNADLKAFQGAATLKHLNVLGSGLTDASLGTVLEGCPVLTTLNISSCQSITVLRAVPRLEQLVARNCSKLATGDGDFERLQALGVAHCGKLVSLGNCTFNELGKLNISRCTHLDALPPSWPKLRHLDGWPVAVPRIHHARPFSDRCCGVGGVGPRNSSFATSEPRR